MAQSQKEQNIELVTTRERLARNETQFQCLAEGFNNLRSNVADLNREVADKKISKDDICPEVMPRWNSWTAPTAEAPAVQPVTGSIKVTK